MELRKHGAEFTEDNIISFKGFTVHHPSHTLKGKSSDFMHSQKTLIKRIREQKRMTFLASQWFFIFHTEEKSQT